MNDDLSDEDSELLGVLILRQHAMLLHCVRDANSESYDEDDDEHDERDEQVAADLGPHAQNRPDDYGHEEHTERHVSDVLPL